VTKTLFDEAIEQLEKISIPQRMGGKTPCIQGYAKQGMTRHRVKIPLFDKMIEDLEKV